MHEPIPPGQLIRRTRLVLHLTQAQPAERIHVTAKAVSKWERGVSHS